jgi:hypothetical protein
VDIGKKADEELNKSTNVFWQMNPGSLKISSRGEGSKRITSLRPAWLK